MERYVSGDLYIEPTAANCRHCGSNAVLDFYASSDGKMFRYVQCGDPDCDQQSPLADTIEDAVSMWNEQNFDYFAFIEKQDAEMADLKTTIDTYSETITRLRRSLSEVLNECAVAGVELERAKSALAKANCKPDGEAWVVGDWTSALWNSSYFSTIGFMAMLQDDADALASSLSSREAKARKIQWRFVDDQ